MKFDIFFSICQAEIQNHLPSEKEMFQNFFDQVELADQLGFETAWVAENHLSCETQKKNPGAVIPHFKGEVGLNTDILQLAPQIFARTKKIHVGSAIRNILCNGGPVAHAEAVKTFLTLHEHSAYKDRLLFLGFAAGRFDFSNRPYGIGPRNDIEKAAWPALKGVIFAQATEIFLRLLKGETISSKDVKPLVLKEENFRKKEDWKKFWGLYEQSNSEATPVKAGQSIDIEPFWNFEPLSIVPQNPNLDALRLVIGTHDPKLQIEANKYHPVSTFNLSITPPQIIEETHKRMAEHYKAGNWSRDQLPRTMMVFVNDDPGLSAAEQNQKAKAQAEVAWEAYWTAMEGTVDPAKLKGAIENSLHGNPEQVIAQIKEQFHSEDRLMCWFDFNNHNNAEVKSGMKAFMEKVAPVLQS